MRLIAICSCMLIFLTACGNSNQVYGLGLVPQKVTGDENSVNVFNVYSAGDAFPLASKWCSKYDKKAVFEKMSVISANFNCQ